MNIPFNLTRRHITFALLAVLAVLAVATLVGAPLVSPEHLAGLGMVPMALSGELDLKAQLGQLTDTAKAAKEIVEQVKRAHVELDGRVEKLQQEMASGKADAVTKAAFQDAVA